MPGKTVSTARCPRCGCCDHCDSRHQPNDLLCPLDPAVTEEQIDEMLRAGGADLDEVAAQGDFLARVCKQIADLKNEKAILERTVERLARHVWVDGPDGSKYHCARCGISKCDDHDAYGTCDRWRVQQPEPDDEG